MASSGDNGGMTGFFKSIPVDQIASYYRQAVDYGVVDVAVHPFDFADVLIRLGYEPFPPVEESSIFHRSLLLPGITSYVYYLYSIDGMNGLFRGVFPYVTSTLIYRHLSTYLTDSCSPIPREPPSDEPRLSERFTQGNLVHFSKTRLWRLLSNVVALHVAYPFHVIAVRTMARFVTAGAAIEAFRVEVSDLSWFMEIGRINGLGELFAGCPARVIKEIAFTLISGGCFLAIMKVVHFANADQSQADNLERSVEYIGNSIATVYINPFRNASEMMIINHTDIPLGNLPFIEHYSSSFDCIRRLRKDRKWKTSASSGLFSMSRYYHGPSEVRGDRLIAKDTYFGPAYMPPYARDLDDVSGFLRGYYRSWNNYDMGGGSSGDAGTRNRGNAVTQTSYDSAPLSVIGSQTFYLYRSTFNPLGL